LYRVNELNIFSFFAIFLQFFFFDALFDLCFCCRFLLENLDWLTDQLGDYADDYLIIDCPGQIELYSHMGVMSSILSTLTDLGYLGQFLKSFIEI